MDNPQDIFEAAIRLLLEKFPSQRSNKYNDEEWILYDQYIPQVLVLAGNYNDSQGKKNALYPTMNFVSLLTNAAKSSRP